MYISQIFLWSILFPVHILLYHVAMGYHVTMHYFESTFYYFPYCPVYGLPSPSTDGMCWTTKKARTHTPLSHCYSYHVTTNFLNQNFNISYTVQYIHFYCVAVDYLIVHFTVSYTVQYAHSSTVLLRATMWPLLIIVIQLIAFYVFWA